MTLTVLLWMAIGFFSGSLMFSYWLARYVLKQDLRAVGDGNPGSTNVIKAGGARIGLLALLLDFLKGSIPVSIARYAVGIYGIPGVLVALAPIYGHAFSPFLGFRGGKAVAVTAGVWTAITLWEAPTLAGIALGVMFAVTRSSGWAIAMTGAIMLSYYLITQPSIEIVLLWIGTFALIGWKYRADLMRPPVLRGWLQKRLWRSA